MRHKVDRWQLSLLAVIALMMAVITGLVAGGQAAFAWSPGAGQNVVVDNGYSFSGKTTNGTERPMLTLINTNAVRLNGPPAGAIFFTVANTEMMRIANNGNVGIGDSTPTEGKLVVSTNSGTAGIYGVNSGTGVAIDGISNGGIAISGSSTNSYAVYGISTNNVAVYAISVNAAGIYGYSSYSNGIQGQSSTGTGVYAQTSSGDLFRGFCGELRFKVDNVGNVTADGTYTSPAADFAEMLPAYGGMEPGDVLVIGANGSLALSELSESTAVAGVYSTKPGFVGGGGDDEDLTGKVPLAVVGVVPVKASAGNGSINPGDLLCTSDIPGHAMKAAQPKVGTIIGKALEGLTSGTGTIKVLLTLQ